MDSDHRPDSPEKEKRLAIATPPPGEFRYSVRRMLLGMALVGACLAGFRVLSESWSLWLATAAFYLAVVLLFTPRSR